MALANATVTAVISRNMGAEQGPPGVAEAAAGGGDSMFGGGDVIDRAPREAAAAAAAAAWSDARPLSEQLPTYPATCLLAAVFVTVRTGKSFLRKVQLLLVHSMERMHCICT